MKVGYHHAVFLSQFIHELGEYALKEFARSGRRLLEWTYHKDFDLAVVKSFVQFGSCSDEDSSSRYSVLEFDVEFVSGVSLYSEFADYLISGCSSAILSSRVDTIRLVTDHSIQSFELSECGVHFSQPKIN